MSKKSNSNVIKFNTDTVENSFLLNEFASPFYKGDILWQNAIQYIAYSMLNTKGMGKKQAIPNNALRAKIIGAFDPFKCRYFLTKKGLESNSAELRQDADAVYEKILRIAISSKFGQNPMLLGLLTQTGDAEIVYDNQYDSVLGNGRDGKGENKLGKALMSFRDKIMNEYTLREPTDVFNISATICESIMVEGK